MMACVLLFFFFFYSLFPVSGGKIDTYQIPQNITQAAARRDAVAKVREFSLLSHTNLCNHYYCFVLFYPCSRNL